MRMKDVKQKAGELTMFPWIRWGDSGGSKQESGTTTFRRVIWAAGGGRGRKRLEAGRPRMRGKGPLRGQAPSGGQGRRKGHRAGPGKLLA